MNSIEIDNFIDLCRSKIDIGLNSDIKLSTYIKDNYKNNDPEIKKNLKIIFNALVSEGALFLFMEYGRKLNYTLTNIEACGDLANYLKEKFPDLIAEDPKKIYDLEYLKNFCFTRAG